MLLSTPPLLPPPEDPDPEHIRAEVVEQGEVAGEDADQLLYGGCSPTARDACIRSGSRYIVVWARWAVAVVTRCGRVRTGWCKEEEVWFCVGAHVVEDQARAGLHKTVKKHLHQDPKDPSPKIPPLRGGTLLGISDADGMMLRWLLCALCVPPSASTTRQHTALGYTHSTLAAKPGTLNNYGD